AVTAFFGFLAGWTEFYFSWAFLDPAKNGTLSMALYGMVGQYAANTKWSEFAAFSILVALPVSVVYFFLQRYIISGVPVGGVKGGAGVRGLGCMATRGTVSAPWLPACASALV